MAVPLVLLIAGGVVAAVFQAKVSGADAAASRRQAAIAAARHAVIDLTTADYRNPGQYIARLKADGTGKFLTLFSNSATGFRAVLERGKVQTAGQIADVGVQQVGQDTAKLTVLAYVTVKNSETPKGTQRTYRLAVSQISAGSRWLVSNVEFVN